MYWSTAMALRAGDGDPGGGEGRVRAHAGDHQHQPGPHVEGPVTEQDELVVVGLHRADRSVCVQRDAVAAQLGGHLGAQLGVHGGQHLGQLLDDGDLQTAGGQRLGHLQSDVAGPDDRRGARPAAVQGGHDGEGVGHGVQHVQPLLRTQSVQAVDGRALRHRAGGHDQPVVAHRVGHTSGVPHGDPPACRVDPGGRCVQPQPHPGRRQLGDAAVRQIPGVGHLARDVVRDTADRVVGVAVGDQHRHLDAGIEFAGPQRRGDTGVAATDDHQMHAWHPFLSAGIRGLRCGCTGPATRRPGVPVRSSGWG
jgi:hypothetical protein